MAVYGNIGNIGGLQEVRPRMPAPTQPGIATPARSSMPMFFPQRSITAQQVEPFRPRLEPRETTLPTAPQFEARETTLPVPRLEARETTLPIAPRLLEARETTLPTAPGFEPLRPPITPQVDEPITPFTPQVDELVEPRPETPTMNPLAQRFINVGDIHIPGLGFIMLQKQTLGGRPSLDMVLSHKLTKPGSMQHPRWWHGYDVFYYLRTKFGDASMRKVLEAAGLNPDEYFEEPRPNIPMVQ